MFFRLLGSSEPLTSDEESENEDSDLDEMGKTIESILSTKPRQEVAFIVSSFTASWFR